jgi:hypothetical protein
VSVVSCRAGGSSILTCAVDRWRRPAARESRGTPNAGAARTQIRSKLKTDERPRARHPGSWWSRAHDDREDHAKPIAICRECSRSSRPHKAKSRRIDDFVFDLISSRSLRGQGSLVWSVDVVQVVVVESVSALRSGSFCQPAASQAVRLNVSPVLAACDIGRHALAAQCSLLTWPMYVNQRALPLPVRHYEPRTSARGCASTTQGLSNAAVRTSQVGARRKQRGPLRKFAIFSSPYVRPCNCEPANKPDAT